MGGWPKGPGMWIPPPVLGTDNVHALGASRRTIGAGGTPTSTAWPAANRAIAIPIWLPDAMVVSSLFIANGGTASGNLDLGIYTIDGAKVVAKGTTAQTGTSTLQILTVTATPVGPGPYYMVAVLDSTAGFAQAYATAVVAEQQMGVVQSAAAVPLAATLTFASPAATFIPLMGISTITTY